MHKISKKIILTLLLSVMLFAVILATVVILKQVNNKQIVAVTASEMITSLTPANTIKALSSSKYRQETTDPINMTLKLEDKKYSITLSSALSLMYTAKSSSKKSDTQDVQKEVSKYAGQKELSEASYNTPNTDEASFKTYSNDKVVCQLSSHWLLSDSSAPQFHTFTCIDKVNIEKEYAFIEKLLSIYKKTKKLPAFTHLYRHTKTDGNKSFSLMSFDSDNKLYDLLFVSVDNAWDYIGDLQAGDVKYASAKYIITPELKTKISDPKYGGFLEKYFY